MIMPFRTEHTAPIEDSGVLNKLVGVDLFNFLFEILVAELFTLEPSSLFVSSSDTDL